MQSSMLIARINNSSCNMQNVIDFVFMCTVIKTCDCEAMTVK